MRELASASGTAFFQDAQRLVVAKRGGSGFPVAIFVCGLFAFIFGVNGLAQLGLAVNGGGSVLLGVIFGAVGAAGLGAVMGLVAAWRRLGRRPPEALPKICVLDFATGTLENGSGRPLAPLSHVRWGKAMQLTSSSPSLVLHYPGGRLQLAKGNAFAGGIAPLEDVLSQWGIPRA
jgi:hypothetical protein